MKIMAVFAVLLAAALFVGAASADVTRNVSNQNGLAFVYETINISINDAAMASTTPVLIKFSEGSNPTAVNTIYGEKTEPGYAKFTLYDSAVGSHYGTYYATTNYSNASSAGSVSIWYPDLTLKAELATVSGTSATTSGDSIDGKSVNKNTNVAFLIDAPRVGPAYNAANFNVAAQIVFTTPIAGKTTYFGEYDFSKTDLTGPQVKANAIKDGNIYQYASAGLNAPAGVYTAYAEFKDFNVDGEKLFSGFKENAKKSNSVTFTVQSTTLVLTSEQESVVRSNPFTVTIQGNSNSLYFVYLDGISASDKNPKLQQGQSGMKTTIDQDIIPTGVIIANKDDANVMGSYAFFETDASGKRTIQYNTVADTEDKTYTIKVYEINEDWGSPSYSVTSNYDSVKVKVEKGSVSIAVSDDGSYFIGDEIRLTGTNTDSSTVYLFITGPNLATNGLSLKSLGTTTIEPAKNNTVPISVNTDNTWEYKWNTANSGLDTGAYTIYATSILTNGKSSDWDTGKNGEIAAKLSDSEYATISINLKQPFLSAVPSGTTVAKGDKIYIRGIAEGDPSYLQIYIFGPNFYQTATITVEDDATYEKKLDIGSEWASNQYFVVIEHPMYNDVIDVKEVKYDNDNQPIPTSSSAHTVSYTTLEIANFGNNTAGNVGLQASFIVDGKGKLQGSNAADALTKMIDSANIDDLYTKLTFTVAEPWIKVNNPGDQSTGSQFSITGTTNLAVGDQLLVEVVSSSFNAIDKTSTSSTSGVSQSTKVVQGDTDNTWSVDVDTTNWKIDEYTIKVSGIEVDVTTTINFNLVDKSVATKPITAATPTTVSTGAAETKTATPTTVSTDAAETTTATSAAPTQTPGFGAFIALAGLGAVALLVLRRN
ncbi:MAG TPA: MEMAR_RS02690 family S-layer glycoprotein [Methanocorpusculum sp.]|nr:MEMAR_RS02690 family S-layer glycoprotein [Methanocorpusculum sp.]